MVLSCNKDYYYYYYYNLWKGDNPEVTAAVVMWIVVTLPPSFDIQQDSWLARIMGFSVTLFLGSCRRWIIHLSREIWFSIVFLFALPSLHGSSRRNELPTLTECFKLFHPVVPAVASWQWSFQLQTTFWAPVRYILSVFLPITFPTEPLNSNSWSSLGDFCLPLSSWLRISG